MSRRAAALGQADLLAQKVVVSVQRCHQATSGSADTALPPAA